MRPSREALMTFKASVHLRCLGTMARRRGTFQYGMKAVLRYSASLKAVYTACAQATKGQVSSWRLS